ncbi:GNAT family N-acetyltransferase [Streptomyces tirandamycinicus]|uniref:GNAT family N-acetyltransferase n=1 Tax=Streptomyces tirandamycinicus TaxID=2174846 RepID=UPI00226F5289|nr:GNAT family N-acetyltransferase [Streptomyces tirandamycinicus]MCY0983191.1 GNAT family N-acetyltransferase [Streptomyces tirandamycinicus]
MDITIRPAEPGDHEALGAVTTRAYLDGGLLDFGEDDPYLAVLRDVPRRAAEAEVLVAADRGGRLVGGVTFTPYGGSWAEVAGPLEAEFRMLAVDPAARGRGVGEALVRACAERARALGCQRLVLSTHSAMHAAHRLYGRLGFARTPGRDWTPVPGMPPLLTYALEL